jgi:hypothetical protein
MFYWVDNIGMTKHYASLEENVTAAAVVVVVVVVVLRPAR